MDGLKAALTHMPRMLNVKGLSEKPEDQLCSTCNTSTPWSLTEVSPESADGARDGWYIAHREPCECEEAEENARLAAQAKAATDLRIAQLLSKSGLVGRYADMKFKGMQWHEKQKPMANAAVEFIREWPKRKGFILSGPAGTGKTHIIAATVRIFCTQTPLVAAEFWPSVKLQYTMSRMLMQDRTDDEHPADRFVSLPVLALDDLGQEKLTDRGRDSLYCVIDGRYVMERPIIATTNKTPEELEAHIGTAMVDRLLGMCEWIPVEGVPSYRLPAERGGK